MNTKCMIFGIELALAACLLPAHAQTRTVTTAPPLPSEGQCQSEVLKFERVISFIRESQGPQEATKVKEKLLPAKVENEILGRDGYCGIARHLREKKLLS